MGVDPVEEALELGVAEGLLERSRNLAVALAEAKEPLGRRVERVVVVGRERLALDDRVGVVDVPAGVASVPLRR
jgi:hypothetical protein